MTLKRHYFTNCGHQKLAFHLFLFFLLCVDLVINFKDVAQRVSVDIGIFYLASVK